MSVHHYVCNVKANVQLSKYSRKNFDRHFQESRHAFGMRALGLPNTKHFHEITRIEDALAREYSIDISRGVY